METINPDCLCRYLTAIAMSDPVALATVYHATIAQVLAKAHHVVFRKEDAEEIANDVYLYVWQNASAYDPSKAGVR